MVAKRPIGDKIPTEHLHALCLEFGTKPETLTLLRRIFKDSLAPHIAALLASEQLIDIYSYADRANELYVLYAPNAASTVRSIRALLRQHRVDANTEGTLNSGRLTEYQGRQY